MSTLLRRLCLALSTFLSLNLSCSKLAPPDANLAPWFWFVRGGRCAELLLLEVGVILVCVEALDSGRGEGRDLLDP